MKPTPTPWTLGQVNKRSQTAFIDAMHKDPEMRHKTWQEMIQCNGCYDLPEVGIAKAEANARHIVHCVNNYDRLREALRDVSELDYMSMENALAWLEDNCPDIRTLLQELDNLEKGND